MIRRAFPTVHIDLDLGEDGLSLAFSPPLSQIIDSTLSMIHSIAGAFSSIPALTTSLLESDFNIFSAKKMTVACLPEIVAAAENSVKTALAPGLASLVSFQGEFSCFEQLIGGELGREVEKELEKPISFADLKNQILAMQELISKIRGYPHKVQLSRYFVDCSPLLDKIQNRAKGE